MTPSTPAHLRASTASALVFVAALEHLPLEVCTAIDFWHRERVRETPATVPGASLAEATEPPRRERG